mgnify:FL=1
MSELLASSGEASERATQKKPRESWILFIAIGVFARPLQPSSLFPSLSLSPLRCARALVFPSLDLFPSQQAHKRRGNRNKKPEPKNKNKQPPPVPARGPARPRPRCAEGRGLRLGPRRRRARRCQARAGPRGRGQVVRGGFGGGEAALPRGDNRRRRRGRRRWWRFERRSDFELSRRRRDPDSRGGVLRSHAGDGEWRASGLPQEVVLGRS